ncbi:MULTISPECIES: hypothetical protein [Neorhizobium]|uniref:hypothetical protein n=1 Tax=Neorhizobium TaxID=1525371 RepID=UPI000CF8D2E2|nr:MULTISPECIES: hypothetical protein [Neorhizobium]
MTSTKRLPLPVDWLDANSVRLSEKSTRVWRAGEFSLAEITNNGLNFLDDVRASRAVFADFDDETVEIVVNSAAYQVFGVDAQTLFTQNIGGEVICINYLDNIDVKANRNLTEFCRTYCAFMSGVYLARARIIPVGLDDERCFAVLASTAQDIRHLIDGLSEEYLAEGCYWPMQLAKLAEGATPISAGLEYYIKKHRIVLS